MDLSNEKPGFKWVNLCRYTSVKNKMLLEGLTPTQAAFLDTPDAPAPE